MPFQRNLSEMYIFLINEINEIIFRFTNFLTKLFVEFERYEQKEWVNYSKIQNKYLLYIFFELPHNGSESWTLRKAYLLKLEAF